MKINLEELAKGIAYERQLLIRARDAELDLQLSIAQNLERIADALEERNAATLAR